MIQQMRTDLLSAAMLMRVVIFATLWMILAGTAPNSWIIGLPSVLLAAWVSLKLIPPLPYQLSSMGLIQFVAFFLRESLNGGWDVARRTLLPKVDIAPGELDYTSKLPAGLPMGLFSNCVSLLPGTLSQRLQGNTVRMHVLDSGVDQQAAMQRLEQRIARMLKIRLETHHE